MRKALLISFLLVFAASSWANEHMSADQQAVWDVVAASWVAESSEDGAWPGEFVHASAHSWTAEWPGLRDADSIAAWSRFGQERRETLNYELFPHGVVVEGDTAIAFYSFVQVVKTDDEYERESSGLVETLIRTADGWKFLALTGFDHD